MSSADRPARGRMALRDAPPSLGGGTAPAMRTAVASLEAAPRTGEGTAYFIASFCGTRGGVQSPLTANDVSIDASAIRTHPNFRLGLFVSSFLWKGRAERR